MAGFDVSGIGGNQPGPSGLFMALDPKYQAQQLDNQATQLALKRATAFQNGVPTNSDGSIDVDTMGRTQIQNGDAAGGLGLMMSGLKLQMLRDPATVANPTGQGGGTAGAGGGGAGLLAGLAPAAGGGGIALGAGGDDYGRQGGGVGQIGTGGQGAPVAAPQSDVGSQNSRGGNPTAGANPDVVGYIRSAFTARGINPNVALGVAGAEGLRGFDPNGNANAGDGGSSFGPFQLHMGGIASGGNSVAGLGDDFAKATGLDPRDPSTWKQQVDFVADHVAQNGWSAFHGAKAAKIGDWQGIGDQPPAGGQPPVASAAASGQGAPAGLISFGGSASSAPAASSAPSGASDDTSGQPPVSDAMYQTAKRVVGHFENADPSSMSLEQQRAVTMSTDVISRYEAGQGGSASGGTVNGVPTVPTDDAPKSGMHPFAPGGGGIKSAPIAPSSQQGQALAADAQQQGGGFQPVSFGGPAGGSGAPQLAGAAAGGAPASPQGGSVQPVSFGGGAPAGPVGASQGAAPAPGGMPPQVAAALQRLQNRQGSPADSQLWGAYQRQAGQGMAGPAGGGPVGAVARPMVPNGGGAPGMAPSSPGGASAPSSGPDLPYLTGQYAAPGGGAAYVTAVLDQARRYALAGEPQAAQAFELRAKQVQDDLQAVNKSKLDLQTHNAELGDQQKLYRDAQGQGFTGSYLDFQNALATGKANAREQARLSADTDDSRVSFAQKEAAARAAGAAQYKFVSSQPVPGGPTVYTSEADLAGGNGGNPAVKDQPAVFAQKQEALGKLDGEMQGQYQQRQVAQERLDAMSNLLETFQSGAGADAKAAAVAAVRAAGFNIPDGATANPTAVEQFSKNATANVFQNAKDMGGRVLVSELDGLQKANANPNMQPASNAAILGQQKGLLNWEDQHYQDYSAWRNANPYATDASSFETAWAKAHPVGAYVSAAKKDIAPLGAPLPSQSQLSDGQAYMVKGQKVRWDGSSSTFVPFSGSTAPTLPGQGQRGGSGHSQAAQGSQGQGQGQQQQQSAPPVAGARQARDGNWYVSDPGRPGKFMMVSR